MPSFRPSVNEAREFLEISSDFGNPKEIIREAVSNSFDAKATEIRISTVIDKSTGEDELVITIADNGEGMTEGQLQFFFGLGFTNRVETDEYGNKISDAIGEKGHGTKVYFNSRRIEVVTVRDGKRINATLDEPRKKLRKGEVPEVQYEITPTSDESGTIIIVRGYNNNIQMGFSHGEIKDYIYWFTKFGSFEREVNITKHKDVTILLAGLGLNGSESLNFGHPFPNEVNNIKELKDIDKVSPFEHYVARWAFPSQSVIGMPGTTIDFVFYIEGNKAKKDYNKMIRDPYEHSPGKYRVEERYGLWLCKDYIPIERNNGLVAKRSEWTKYHAFVNCQEFRLTANRGDLGNTPPNIMHAVEQTVKDIFEKQIETSEKFKRYLDELEKEENELRAKQAAEWEESDFERRIKEALSKKVAKLENTELIEPRQESGVFSLLLQLLTLKSDLFSFKIIDYDTRIGYDLLVTQDSALDLERASKQFVELKRELGRSFDHSFKKLAAVICWDTKLTNDEEVTDRTGTKRKMRITPPDEETKYTKYMLVSDTEKHNIEVFVLKDYLRELLKLEFRPRTKTQDTKM